MRTPAIATLAFIGMLAVPALALDPSNTTLAAARPDTAPAAQAATPAVVQAAPAPDALPAAPQPAPVPSTKPTPAAADSGSGWYLGVAVGTGVGHFTIGGTSYDLKQLNGDRDPTTIALAIRTGARFGDVLLGADVRRFQSSASGSGLPDSSVVVNAVDLMGTMYSGGGFLRAGFGPAQATFEALGHSQAYSGFDVTVGAGFGTDPTTGLGLSLAVDISRQAYSGANAPDDSTLYVLSLALDI